MLAAAGRESLLMHDFKFGIEEEYFVVDRRTALVKSTLWQPFMKAAKKKLGPNVMYELLQSKIEIATNPVTSSQEALGQLTYFRSTLAEVGRDHNIGIIAAGTHPLALPHHQQMTQKPRYQKVAEDRPTAR
jgi:glutamate---cysteine ligase / carboxylate-amine ligase